ncbi:MAG TPA: hypothetical protein PLH93_02325 [Flavobacteriales bacterium]|nr:hypothetical protein [Flavobacteriales bacterium]
MRTAKTLERASALVMHRRIALPAWMADGELWCLLLVGLLLLFVP